MANFYTRFSFSISMPPEQVEALKEVIESTESVREDGCLPLGVRLATYNERTEEAVLTHPEGGRGEPADAGLVVSKFLDEIGSGESITFTYANTCGKPRVDAFAGGLVIADREDYNVESVYGDKREAEQIAEQDGFRVKTEIDVNADSPEEAARKAQAHFQRPNTAATVFEVHAPGRYRIDLDEITSREDGSEKQEGIEKTNER